MTSVPLSLRADGRQCNLTLNNTTVPRPRRSNMLIKSWQSLCHQKKHTHTQCVEWQSLLVDGSQGAAPIRVHYLEALIRPPGSIRWSERISF